MELELWEDMFKAWALFGEGVNSRRGGGDRIPRVVLGFETHRGPNGAEAQRAVGLGPRRSPLVPGSPFILAA